MNKAAYHIYNFYGEQALSYLLRSLAEQKPLSDIAARLGVSKQRVHQWKTALGKDEINWQPYEEVVDFLKSIKKG